MKKTIKLNHEPSSEELSGFVDCHVITPTREYRYDKDGHLSGALIKTRSLQGKRNRQAGARFEGIVRDDLISKGWNVSKFQSNVEFKEANWLTKCSDLKIIEKGKLIPAKGNRFRARTLGFPDFICWKIGELITNNANKSEKEVFDYINKPITKKIMYKDCKVFYKTMGVEAKSDGYLDKIEKAKCEWLLKNKVFSHILIAKKTKKGRKIIPEYIDFKEKYQSLRKKRK